MDYSVLTIADRYSRNTLYWFDKQSHLHFSQAPEKETSHQLSPSEKNGRNVMRQHEGKQGFIVIEDVYSPDYIWSYSAFKNVDSPFHKNLYIYWRFYLIDQHKVVLNWNVEWERIPGLHMVLQIKIGKFWCVFVLVLTGPLPSMNMLWSKSFQCWIGCIFIFVVSL